MWDEQHDRHVLHGLMRLVRPEFTQATWDAFRRLALDGVQVIWRRQWDFIGEAVEGLTTLAGDFAQPLGPLNQKVAKHADYSRRAIQKNLTNGRELTELATRAINIKAKIFFILQAYFPGAPGAGGGPPGP